MKKIVLELNFDEDLSQVIKKNYPSCKDFRIISRSLDARKAPLGRKPKFIYKIELLESENEKFEQISETFYDLSSKWKGPPVIIVGLGPAGLFAALRLNEYSIPTIIFERGDSAQKRMLKIARFWRHGELDPESNVCYGEGGAGLFSDGKLITRIKSPYIAYVMNKLVTFGAPKETAYLKDPHLGSNKIRQLITHITSFLLSQGHKIFTNTRVDELIINPESGKVEGVRLNDGREFHSNHVILATGHSAEEMYRYLKRIGVKMKAKSFAMGFRIEHPRRLIDKLQFGKFLQKSEWAQKLGAAKYRLVHHQEETNRGTYSFCMCPGGYVLSSGTDAQGLVVNGMSNYAHNSPWSNSAIVVSILAGKDFHDELAGIDLQKDVEKKAYDYSVELASGREIPALTLGEFLAGKVDTKRPLPKGSCPSGMVKAPIFNLYKSEINQHLITALNKFDQNIPGIVNEDAVLLAPETRTSSPLTIVRDEVTLESLSHPNLFPCGEGAGYAGGITSAAVDGIKVAESIVKNFLL